MQREDREGRPAAAGGSGGGTEDKWTEEDFKRRVRERLEGCCLDHGEEGMGRWVGWGILAHNLRQIARRQAGRQVA